MEKINKKISEAFKKKIYLLGIDKDNKHVWLEAPSWDCDWYWGFGYIERYTNNQYPHRSRDISSHTHWDSEIIGKLEIWEPDAEKYVLSDKYIYHINENPNFKATVLTESESWLLSEYMKTFYKLKESAEFFGKGSSGVTTNPLKDKLVNKEITDNINKNLLPMLFKKIDELLSPDINQKKE